MLARRLAAQAPAWAAAAAAAVGARGAATKAVSKAGAPSPSTEVGKDDITTTLPGQAFVGDLRSTSALCVGDGITTHTAKWLQVGCGLGVGMGWAQGGQHATAACLQGPHAFSGAARGHEWRNAR